MYTGRRYPLGRTLIWTWDFLAVPALWTLVVFALYHNLQWDWMELPPTALAVLGTAVSFYLGFKGNAAYGRLWEARKIWGGIVNSSRTWGAFVTGYVTTRFVPDPDTKHDLDVIHKELVYRHLAWLGALRTLLRRPRPWETQVRTARKFRKLMPCCTALAWVFLTWNKIVDWSENPFDGLGNDIPIDALSRTIEIDLREMLGETDLPPKLEAKESILM